MPLSSLSPRNRGRTITKCKALCLVRSLEELTLSILAAHPTSLQRKRSVTSRWRRMERKIKLVLHSISTALLYHLSLHQAPLCQHLFLHCLAPLCQHLFLRCPAPLCQHLFPCCPAPLHQHLLLHCLAPSLPPVVHCRHLLPLLLQLFSVMLSRVILLWALLILLRPVMRTVARSENASSIQDRQVARLPAPSDHQKVGLPILTLLS